jgi:hypothetical protein
VQNVSGIAFDRYLDEQFGEVPFGIFGDEAHDRKLKGVWVAAP